MQSMGIAMDKITVVVATVDPARMSSAEIRHISSYTNDKMPKKKKHTMVLPFSVVSGSAIVLINGDSDVSSRDFYGCCYQLSWFAREAKIADISTKHA